MSAPLFYCAPSLWDSRAQSPCGGYCCAPRRELRSTECWQVALFLRVWAHLARDTTIRPPCRRMDVGCITDSRLGGCSGSPRSIPSSNAQITRPPEILDSTSSITTGHTPSCVRSMNRAYTYDAMVDFEDDSSCVYFQVLTSLTSKDHI
jgi:hypothetical protein